MSSAVGPRPPLVTMRSTPSVGEEPQLRLDVVGAVAADGDVGQFNAQLEQPVGDPGAVAVLDPSGQHLGSRDNDAGACAHVQRHYGRPVMSFSVTAPKSLRELFDQLGLQEVPSLTAPWPCRCPSTNEPSTPPGGLQGGLIATMADVTAGQLASRSTPFGYAHRHHRPVHSLSAAHQGRSGACGRAHPAHGQALGAWCRWTSTAATTTRSARRRR